MENESEAAITPLAVVTGASDGIGYELARQFAEYGYDLVIAAADAGIVEARQALEDLGSTVHAVQVDLATFDGVELLYARIRELNRPLDAIAINAGVGVGGSFAPEAQLQDELKIISLNVTSVVHLAKRVAKDMVEQGSGRILFTASTAATMPAPFLAVYDASRAFVLSFAESLRDEVKDTGVAVTTFMPGPPDREECDPAAAARQGFDALMAGRDHATSASLTGKLQGLSGMVPSETAGK